jgi:hypothetical protein
MNDASIKAFTNELNLKCPHCGGSIKVNHITGDEIILDHYLNIPGKKITSNLPKCQTLDTDIAQLIVSFKNNLMQLHTLRESLAKIAVV